MRLDAAIIGGGVTGLTLAFHLKRAGRRFVVLEPGELGGLIRTSCKEGFTMEHGPNVFLDKAGFAPFLQEIGLPPEELIYPRAKRFGQYIWFDGRARRLPKSLGAFIASDLFTLGEKLRLAALPLRLLWRLPAPRAEDESVACFAARMLGAGPVARVIDPALKGIFGGDADRLSARSVFPLFWEKAVEGSALRGYIAARRDMSGGHRHRGMMFVLRRGAASLVQRLAQNLTGEDLLPAPAVGLKYLGPESGFEVSAARGGSVKARRVFVTTSGPASAGLLGDLAPGLSRALARLRYAALAVVHCHVPRGAPLHQDGFGVLFSGQSASRLLGIMYNSELFPHTAPPDRQLLTVMLGGVAAEEVCLRTDEELAAAVRAELEDKLGIREAGMLAFHRWPRAIPQYEVGHFRLVEEMAEVERKYAGLHFIGADRGGVPVPDRVRRVREVLE